MDDMNLSHFFPSITLKARWRPLTDPVRSRLFLILNIALGRAKRDKDYPPPWYRRVARRDLGKIADEWPSSFTENLLSAAPIWLRDCFRAFCRSVSKLIKRECLMLDLSTKSPTRPPRRKIVDTSRDPRTKSFITKTGCYAEAHFFVSNCLGK
jgi:hypothetical protein